MPSGQIDIPIYCNSRSGLFQSRRTWSSRNLREPLFSIGCSKVSSARDKGYVAMFLKPFVSAVTCLADNHWISLVL